MWPECPYSKIWNILFGNSLYFWSYSYFLLFCDNQEMNMSEDKCNLAWLSQYPPRKNTIGSRWTRYPYCTIWEGKVVVFVHIYEDRAIFISFFFSLRHWIWLLSNMNLYILENTKPEKCHRLYGKMLSIFYKVVKGSCGNSSYLCIWNLFGTFLWYEDTESE